VLSHAHQALHETEAAILREWEALGVEHQRLSDWRTQLEERTKAASRQFTSERFELERDHKDYKNNLHKVYARELEASQKEKRLAKREEALNQREDVVIELSAKLSAMNEILEEQRIQQTAAVERLQKLQQELEDKARDAALAEEKLKARGESLDRRETDLARRETDLAKREKDLAFKEEMLERREKLLAEHELEAEEKERTLEERVRRFEAAQAAPGPQVAEAAKKALEDLQIEHRTGVQRIAEWAGEASTTLVPLGISPILVSGLPASISDVLPVLDSAAERLRRLDQILGARLEAEGRRLYRAVVDYVLTCFQRHDPAMSLVPVLDGPVAATEDTARESVPDTVETVAALF
jgi:chromosome segregation ATPase